MKITLPQKEIVKFLDTENIKYNIEDNSINLEELNITVLDAIFEKTKNVVLVYFENNEMIINEVTVKEAENIIYQFMKKEI